MKIPDIFNNYFANVVTSLEIPEFDTIDQLAENISQLTLKAIVKYCKHLSITAINQAFQNKYFNFSIIEKKDIFDQIMKLKHKKATQDSDSDFFPSIFTYSLMKQLNHQSFLLC